MFFALLAALFAFNLGIYADYIKKDKKSGSVQLVMNLILAAVCLYCELDYHRFQTLNSSIYTVVVWIALVFMLENIIISLAALKTASNKTLMITLAIVNISFFVYTALYLSAAYNLGNFLRNVLL